ncbi:MAG: methionine--tRNA ligase [Candidatus Eremiobacteraeota bacterium]|nr:methionine--tRNA ligase [Candidatus Eremiobacteraeota bacterium]
MSDRAYYVTTPIYYINSVPHIGHAYTSIAADVLARYARTRGQAFLLTGTDEHGQKVANAAAEAGVSPQAWTDRMAATWQSLCRRYEISYDDFIRTTEERHQSVCVEVFERLKVSGDIYVGKYEGWYCTYDETFWLESKLVDGRCPECRRDVQWLSEDNWFFALSRYRDRLLEHYRTHPDFVRPQRAYNEMLATLEGGLDDLCISRTNLDWGVPLPGGGVMYVWLDALLNYITAIGWSRDEERFRRYWPADVHLIGKEIARFHTIIWPAVLWALGLPEPKSIFAHGWLTIEGEKISKSRGNVFDPFATADFFGADTVRYFLLREAPFGADFSWSDEKVRQRRNSDLGNDLGNLLRRSLTMLQRYRDGIVPPVAGASFGERFGDLGERTAGRIVELDFRGALAEIWELVSALNRAIDEQKPWRLYEQGAQHELDALLYTLCEGLRWLGHLLAPFIPAKAAEIHQQLGVGDELGRNWNEALRWGDLTAGQQTRGGEPLFPRLLD